MKTSKRRRITEITIETDELVIAPSRSPSALWWCHECETRTPVLPIEDATEVAGVDLHTMNGWVNARLVHLCGPGPTGRLICWASLARQL